MLELATHSQMEMALNLLKPCRNVSLCCMQGHFQIVLSRHHSPLMIRGLSPFMRIMYCSGVWSYIVGAITTPLFIIIPLLTIWAGIFPIVISWWAALALTIYYIAQSMVLNYSKKVTTLIFLLITTVDSVCWCITIRIYISQHMSVHSPRWDCCKM